jgi:trigger factor
MATITRENIGLLHDKLVVKVNKDDYFPAFDKKLKEYSKNANIPGFRKGMVPAGMIKKMYGNSIFSDEVLKSVEKELYNYLNTEKPDVFGQPLPLESDLANLNINNPGDYEFGFEIGLKPQFSIADLSKASLTLYKVTITDKMIDEEVNRMQIKGGKMTEPELIDNEENVLNIHFNESDKEGIAIEGGIEKENSVLLKYFTPVLQKKLMGLKKEDSIVFQLKESFEGDKLEMMLQDLGFEKNDAAAAEKYFKLRIAKIGLVEKKELNEAFFKEIFPAKEIKTEEELREALREEIAQYWSSQSRNQLHDQLYHYLLDETKMEFPADFLKRWLQTGGEKVKTAEEAEIEFPGFSNQLSWTLISDRITREHNLQVTKEEVYNSMKAQVMNYFGNMSMGDDTSWLDSYVDRMMKDEKQVEASYRRLGTEKLFQWAESQVSPDEKEISSEELTDMMHHHQH